MLWRPAGECQHAGTGNVFRMRGGFALGKNDAPGTIGRVVRLLVLLGLAVAAYFVLSLFGHAARADPGPIDPLGLTGSLASAKATGDGAGKVIPPPRKVQALRKVRIPPKARAPRTAQAQRMIQSARRIPAPRIRAGGAAGRVQVRASRPLRAVPDAARATVISARKAVVRQRSVIPAKAPSLPRDVDLPRLAQASPSRLAELAGLPLASLPEIPEMPGLPGAELPALPQPPSPAPLRGSPQARTPIPSPTTGPQRPLPPARSVRTGQFPPAPAPALALALVSRLSDVTAPPAHQAQPWTAPLPAPPPQPADRSASTGQARDSGGGDAPVVGTVPSPWRPEVAAAGRRVATDLIARGRTVRYAGPPS